MSDFTPLSVGGAASAALFRALMERDAEKRQTMNDFLLRNDRLAAQQLAEQRAAAEAVKAQRDQARQDAEDRQKAADRLLTYTRPDQDLTPEQADTFRAGGVPVESRTTIPARAGNPFKPDTLEAVLYDRRPETAAERTMRENAAAKKAEADDARAARASEAQAARDARSQEAEANRAFRAEQADLTRAAMETRRQDRLAITPTAEARMIDRLQTQWDKQTSATREMNRQFGLMQTGLDRFDAGDANGGSQAVLVTFQKILDPNSVVRESEYARSAEGTSMLHRLEGYRDRLARGGAGVTRADLAAMVGTAQQFVANQAAYTKGFRQRAERTADRYGIPHELIFADVDTHEPAAKPSAADPLGIR